MISANLEKKTRVMKLVSTLLFVVIALQLGYSQLIRHHLLTELATSMWERSFPIEAPRGLILDRTGTPLTLNLPVMAVNVIPFQIKDPTLTASSLAGILGVSPEIIFKKITKRASIIRLQPEGRRISDEQASKIYQLHLPGVFIVQDSERYYPYGELLSHTLGFVGLDNQGLAGIEAQYDKYLRGTTGSLNYVMDAKGGLFEQFESRLEAPISGLSIQLTIDLTIQEIIEREIKNAYIKYEPESVIALAMNPNTGEILGMASQPSFNSNDYQGVDQEVYNRNLPIWKSYEPGSTFKVFTYAAGLEENVFDMHHEYFYDPGFIYVEGQRIKSWKKGGHGLQTFLEVLENSSNPGLVEIALRLGPEKLFNYITDFGFGKKTGIDLVGESSGIMFTREMYGPLEHATSSFGQGISSTALQLVTGFSSLINGGRLYKPYITKAFVESQVKDIIDLNKPTVVRQVISNNTSNLMREALESVVAKGSGRNAYIDGYRVGGKTGTAQKVANGVYMEGNYILSFIGAAPMNDPQIVVYVAIDNPQSTIQYGGTVAAPIVKAIMEDALPYLGVEKQLEQMEKEYTWMDVKTELVGNYIGLNPDQLPKNLFTWEFVGEGSIIIDQLPKSGVRMEIGSTVVLMRG